MKAQEQFKNLINQPITSVFNVYVNPLLRTGRKTVGDVVTMTESELYSIKSIGKSRAKIIVLKLKQLGLELRPEMVSEFEWLEELQSRFIKVKNKYNSSSDVVHNQTSNEGMRMIAKLIEIWNDDIEKEVEKIINRNM